MIVSRGLGGGCLLVTGGLGHSIFVFEPGDGRFRVRLSLRALVTLTLLPEAVLVSCVSDEEYLGSCVSDEGYLVSCLSDEEYLVSCVSDEEYLQ